MDWPGLRSSGWAARCGLVMAAPTCRMIGPFASARRGQRLHQSVMPTPERDEPADLAVRSAAAVHATHLEEAWRNHPGLWGRASAAWRNQHRSICSVWADNMFCTAALEGLTETSPADRSRAISPPGHSSSVLEQPVVAFVTSCSPACWPAYRTSSRISRARKHASSLQRP